MAEAEDTQQNGVPAGIAGKVLCYLKTLGPGMITGASDDDPSGIGTYAQSGALLGYSQLWTMLFTIPLMIAVQEACARIALQTGYGLAEIIRRHYSRPLLYLCIFLLFVANVFNIGADLGAMAAAGQLVMHNPAVIPDQVTFWIWLVGVAILSIVLEVFIGYRKFARILQFFTLSLLAYVLVAFSVPQHWAAVLRGTLIPSLRFTRDFWLNFVALMGTTISPYLFFWQANQEVEEAIAEGEEQQIERMGASKARIYWMRSDVVSGMVLSNIISWFIIVTAASTLYPHGIHQINSAVEAAQALQPLAGRFAALVFAIGIIGTGLLVIPVLAGSAAYAVSEAFCWREGLYLKLKEAPAFYGVIILATIVGVVLNFIGLNPIRALYYSAAINGLVSPPLLILIMIIANHSGIMKGRTNGILSNIFGWTATLVMTLAAGALVFSIIAGQ